LSIHWLKIINLNALDFYQGFFYCLLFHSFNEINQLVMKKLNWKYAFGEILIVIIGISIAFSMNKCADNSKRKALKIQYLTSLKNDIEADKIQLENNLKEIKEKIALTNQVLPLLKTKSPQKRSTISKIFAVATITNFTPKDISYQTLINSGDFKLIDDFKIKAAIETHYSNYKKMLKAYKRRENINKQYVGDYFINNIDYDAMKKGEFGFENEKLLKNILTSVNGSLQMKKEATLKGIESCSKLITILNNSE
jgi:hypothetical protein